jgi:hypothetical protein
MTYYDRDNDDAQPSMKWPKPHHGSTAEYGTSGWPFVATGTTAADMITSIPVTFEYVTRWIQITNTGAKDLAISFSDPGTVGGLGVIGIAPTTYYEVQAGDISPRLELKCVKLYITSLHGDGTSYSLIAGLTSIPDDGFPDISVITGVAHT